MSGKFMVLLAIWITLMGMGITLRVIRDDVRAIRAECAP